MTQLTVRQAVAADLHQISALFVELDEHHIERRPEEFAELEAPARSIEYISNILATPSSALLVAEDANGELVGMSHMFVREMPATLVAPGRTIAEIDSLVVRSARRREGAGRLLVEAALRWADEQGVAAVELNVRGFNREALAFYENVGFEIASYRMRLAIS